MTAYLLDTNICIYLIKKHPIQVLERLENIDVFEVGISTITLGELEYGINKSSKPYQNRIALTEFVTPLEILSFNSQAAVEFGKIRWDLEGQGKIIGQLDMLIAAQALSIGGTLVTNNVREFKRIDGLKIENWAN